jgi:uncharacterized protein YcnI
MSRSLVRGLAGAGTLALVALGGPALAHVTVNPDTAPAAGYAKLTFRVPTEQDNASTTKVQVFFPAAEPFGEVLVMPQPGWRYKVIDKKLTTPITTDDGQVSQAVSQITWTATSKASAIQPGQFNEFNVSLGPLPDSGTVAFKALQTYSNGDVVRWIQPSVAGQVEPDHPAPTVTIVPADGTTTDTSATTDATSSVGNDGDNNSNGWALSLSVLALAVAGIGAGLGLRKKPA